VKKQCFICKKPLKYYFKKGKYRYYRCQSCFLVATFPVPTPKEIIEHYKNNYSFGNYMLLKKYSKNYLKNYEGMADELKKSLGKKSLKNIKILDIGCFTGDFMEILRKKGANVYGVEIQEEAAKIARKRFKNKIINKDITDLSSFSKNSFDCITMLGLVEHVKDPKKLIEIAEKILKPEGTLMIQTPNNTSLPSKITNKYWPPYTPVEHI
jgi:2-polyprenyl-3-methyl-5-hydroxy-6-metoxy-1,4-benzoquinol methylase